MELEYDLDDPDVAAEMGFDMGGPSASEEALLVPSIPGTTFQVLPEAGMDFPTDFHNELQVKTCFRIYLILKACICMQIVF